MHHQKVDANHYINVSCPSIRLSDATGGERKQLDLEPSYAVSLTTER